MQKTQTTCLAILATIAVGFSLYFLRTVLLPFVIAVFLVIGCRPILEFIEKKLRLHRFFAFVVTFFVGVALFIGFAALTWLSINNLARNSAIYEDRLNDIVSWTIDHIPKSSKSKSNKLNTINPKTTPPKLTTQIRREHCKTISARTWRIYLLRQPTICRGCYCAWPVRYLVCCLMAY